MLVEQVLWREESWDSLLASGTRKRGSQVGLFIHNPPKTSGPSGHPYLFSPRKGLGQVLIITLPRALCPLSPSD